MKIFFESYFGLREGGVNLLKTLNDLSIDQLAVFKEKLENCQGRVFVLGNGGSYDNARWMAQVLRRNGIMSKTPGEEEDYILTINSKGYSEIFAEALKLDGLNEKDLLIGISGSGNSANVLMAFKYAVQEGADVFALGGRDGGLMLKQVGPESCSIADNMCMEAIEDIHNFAFTIVLEAIQTKEHLEEIKDKFVKSLSDFMSTANMNLLSDTATQMLRTIYSNGSVFILGFGIGANHFRSDMGRGATNALPIRGLHCPEVFTMNSLQATANDDGTNFLLVDGLVKFNPTENNFAIICQTGHRALELCEDYLKNKQVPIIEIGGEGIAVDSFPEKYFDLVVTMIGHACGQVIRTHLSSEFRIEPLRGAVELKGAQKKMSMKETIHLEKEFRESGRIAASEAITFCYGEVFRVSSKCDFQREFY